MRAAIDDTIAGEEGHSLPQGWSLVPIASVARLRSEKANPREHGVLPFVGMDDIEADGLTVIRTRPFSEMKSAGNRFHPGDLLYGRLRPYLNKTAVVQSEGACSGELLVIAPSPAIDVRYLQYFMHSRRFVSWVSSVTSGDRPRISFDTAAGFEIPLAPLSEQKRIVARIDGLFAEISEGQAALAQARRGLETFRRAMLRSAVTGQLTEDWRRSNCISEDDKQLLLQIKRLSTEQGSTSMEGLPSLPPDWLWVRAADVTKIITKGTTPRTELMGSAGEVPYIKIQNLDFDGDLHFDRRRTFIDRRTHENSLARSKLFPGDLLINIVGPPLGQTAVVTDEYAEWNMNQAVAVFRFADDLDVHYLHLAFMSSIVQTQLNRKAKATAGQVNLTLETCRNVLLPIPPRAEAKEIVCRAQDALQAQTEFASLLKEDNSPSVLRQSILKSAFEGRLTD